MTFVLWPVFCTCRILCWYEPQRILSSPGNLLVLGLFLVTLQGRIATALHSTSTDRLSWGKPLNELSLKSELELFLWGPSMYSSFLVWDNFLLSLECIVCVSLASCFSHNTMRSVFGANLWTNQDLVWFCSIFLLHVSVLWALQGQLQTQNQKCGTIQVSKLLTYIF